MPSPRDKSQSGSQTASSRIRTLVTYYIILWCNGYLRRGMDMATRVQILDETDCISHSTNTFGKGINPIILPPCMGK